MPYEFYKVIHFLGIFMVLLAFGMSMFFDSINQEYLRTNRKRVAILHGVGLVLAFIAGFGLIARLNIATPWPTWIYAKVGIWVLLGLLMAPIKRGWMKGNSILAAVLLLGAVAAYIAINKPF